MNTDEHGWNRVRAWLMKVKLGAPGWRVWTWRWQIRTLAEDVERWVRTEADTERKWEKLYEGACERAAQMRSDRDGLLARCDQWEKMAEEQRERAQVLQQEVEGLRRGGILETDRANELGDRLRAVYHRAPAVVLETEAGQGRKDMERLMVLAGLAEGNPLWETVLSYADENERNEREVALKPDLVDSQRQYNAGRAAGAYDFAMALRELFVKAQQEARRMKGEK